MKHFLTIAKLFIGAVMAVALLALPAVPFQARAATSYPIGGQQYYLSGAGVTSSAATVPLTSLKTPDGRAITMTMIGGIGYGTLEPQTVAKVESITFTGIVQNANGSASLTGVTRGLDFVYPYAASTTLRQSHSGGSTFIITNTPNFYYDQFAMPTTANVTTWPYASTSPATKGYVDFVAFNGAAVINADTLNKGVVQIGTAAQAAASTALGSSGASLAIPTSVATSTWNGATAGNVIPVTDLSTKKIADNFISTSTLLAATSTINIGAFPAWQIGKQIQTFTSTGTTTFPVPSGITKVSVEVQAGAGSGGSCSNAVSGGGGGGGGGFSFENVDVTGTSTIQVYVGPGGSGDANGSWSTFGTNGFYLSAAGGVAGGVGAGGSVAKAGGAGGVGAGGNINSSGSSGGAGSGDAAAANLAFGGSGGASRYGGGGAGAVGSAAGSAGGNYGGGGGGGACGTNGSQAGGAGGAGIVIVRW